MADTDRGSVPAAAQAALWALSNGRCYYPDCAEPVVKLARPGVYRKNVQVAHIHGVKPGSPRYVDQPVAQRDAFGNLILMCTPHHSEIDNKEDGETRYPANLLRAWKAKHEAGGYGRALEALGALDLDRLGDAFAAMFVPPADRLNAIADQLERTGADNKQAVRHLREVAGLLTDLPPGVDARAARQLAHAAEVFGAIDLEKAARLLSHSAEVFGNSTFTRDVTRLSRAAERQW